MHADGNPILLDRAGRPWKKRLVERAQTRKRKRGVRRSLPTAVAADPGGRTKHSGTEFPTRGTTSVPGKYGRAENARNEKTRTVNFTKSFG